MPPTTRAEKITLDGRRYDLTVKRQVSRPIDAPRLVAVSHLPTEQAWQIVKTLVRTVAAMTPEPHELWIVDNNSPREFAERLLECDGVNAVLNHVEPLPPDQRGLWSKMRGKAAQGLAGSYANAVGLELGQRIIDPESKYLMTLHMDIMPCKIGWLSFLRSKLDKGAAAAGVLLEKSRVPEGVLHILGCMIDHQIYRECGLSFWPALPELDVGDRITVELRNRAHPVFACQTTYADPAMRDTIPPDSPIRRLRVACSFDDGGDVIFMHLGRGIRKSTGDYSGNSSPAEDWIHLGRVLSGAEASE